ncbi:hybrid sensor histidine kinase/response regulator [Massilia timonae]|uniref:hybrid sensor histidine kinase/response regulator n=1 Tax=Massilia timonae TaxID=47229 RepID=UPI0023528EF5|nr:ATP-binding protein [Massilia timonae]
MVPLPHTAFSSDSQVAARMRGHDWHTSSLGPPEGWPPSLRTAVDMMLHSSFPMFIAWGPQFAFLFNDAYIPILGERYPCAPGLPFAEVWPEAWPELRPLVERTVAGETVFFEDLELSLLRNGYPERAWFTFSYAPLVDAAGHVGGLLCTCMETTGRVLAERRAAFQLRVSDALGPIEDPGEVIATASALLGVELGAARVLYAEIDPLSGRLEVPRLWSQDGAAPAALRSPLHDFSPAVVDELRSGAVVQIHDAANDPRTQDLRAAWRDERIGALLVVPLVKSGRLIACLGVDAPTPRSWTGHDVQLARDVAERTWAAAETARAQALLREERDRSRDIFDNISEGFALFDRNWIMQRMNAEGLRICAVTREEVIGRNHWEVFTAMADSEAGRMYHRVMDTRRAGAAEQCHVFPDGRRIWTDIRAYPTQDGGIASFFRDITDRKLAEEKLMDADRRKDEFLAMLAHELRNPLAPISAAAELLRLGNMDERRVHQSSTIIGRQVRHMTRLVDDLLDVSRVTRGLITLGQARVAARAVVEEAVEQVRPTIDARSQQLSVRLPSEHAAVCGDKARLVQVVANVLGNAAKYTPPGRGIDLRAEVLGTRLVLSVRDEGIGMDRELTGRVFDLFTQAERSSDRSQGGLGLGLALVKHLVELHGGTVGCSSPGLGKGSTFVISLPLLQEEETPVPAPGAAGPAGAAPLRILVVDDNHDAAETLGLLLSAQGHEVAIEHASLPALERARGMRPDVCLLDIGLPEMDGRELARRLKADPATGGAVLIAVTGYGQQQDRDAALAAGFAHHLVKPVNVDVLLRVLDGVRGGAGEAEAGAGVTQDPDQQTVAPA